MLKKIGLLSLCVTYNLYSTPSPQRCNHGRHIEKLFKINQCINQLNDLLAYQKNNYLEEIIHKKIYYPDNEVNNVTFDTILNQINNLIKTQYFKKKFPCWQSTKPELEIAALMNSRERMLAWNTLHPKPARVNIDSYNEHTLPTDSPEQSAGRKFLKTTMGYFDDLSDYERLTSDASDNEAYDNPFHLNIFKQYTSDNESIHDDDNENMQSNHSDSLTWSNSSDDE